MGRDRITAVPALPAPGDAPEPAGRPAWDDLAVRRDQPASRQHGAQPTAHSHSRVDAGAVAIRERGVAEHGRTGRAGHHEVGVRAWRSCLPSGPRSIHATCVLNCLYCYFLCQVRSN